MPIVVTTALVGLRIRSIDTNFANCRARLPVTFIRQPWLWKLYYSSTQGFCLVCPAECCEAFWTIILCWSPAYETQWTMHSARYGSLKYIVAAPANATETQYPNQRAAF